MNRRQRKKQSKKQKPTIILRCAMLCKPEQYEKMRQSIEQQISAGSTVVLPAYLQVEAIIQQSGSSRVRIIRESEEKKP